MTDFSFSKAIDNAIDRAGERVEKALFHDVDWSSMPKRAIRAAEDLTGIHIPNLELVSDQGVLGFDLGGAFETKAKPFEGNRLGFADLSRSGDKAAGDKAISGDKRDVSLALRQSIEPNREQLTVHAGGRNIESMVLLPDNYDPQKKYPAVVGLHGFTSNSKDFATSIDAEGLRKSGMIVILPQAGRNEVGLREWQGVGGQNITPGINNGDDGKKVNDTEAIIGTIETAKKQYGIDDKNLNMIGFSQGVAFAFDVADKMDKQNPGSVRRLFAATGTVPNSEKMTLNGTEIVHYEPEHLNYVQKAWNFVRGNPKAEDFLGNIEKNKGCQLMTENTAGSLDSRVYSCKDSTTLTSYRDEKGGHAFPGQPADRDFVVVGRGSRASVKLSSAFLSDVSADARLLIPGEPVAMNS